MERTTKQSSGRKKRQTIKIPVMERRRKQSAGGGRKKRQQTAVDRLSTLPDDTLLHILSFLPTKLSITTGVLSKRWRSLWARVPTLSFHTPSPHSIFHYPYDSHAESDAIHRVMLLHQAPNLDTFSLIATRCTEFQLDTWITAAIRRNVQTIRLERLAPPLVRLPRLILCSSKTLVDLILHFPTGILHDNGVRDVHLPSLKKLHLLHVTYEDDEALVRFLSGCPVLEDFVILRNVDFRSSCCCLKISSPTIKRLQAGFYGNNDDLDSPYGKYEYGMMIDAPALVYLRVDDCCFKHITFSPKGMTSLVEVHIQLIGNYFTTFNEKDNYTRYVVKFLDSLCNVKRLYMMTHLTMEINVLQMLDKQVVGSIANFSNLTALDISNLEVDWDFVLKFLEIADNLQDLIADVRYVEKWVDPEQVPTCMISSLKSVRIDRMMLGEHELSMVRYLLRNALVLEKMELSPVHDDEPDWDEILLDAIQKILFFERGSPECELAFTRSRRRVY